MIPDLSMLIVGSRFDLPTKPGHYFRIQCFARPVRKGEQGTMTDRIDNKVVRFIACQREEATHVKGWESYACFPTVERVLREGSLPR